MAIANEKMGAAGSLVVTIVAHGMSLDDSWPFVTLSSFQERASTIKKLSGALYIGINPVVTPDNREKWEWYSTQSEDSKWYHDGRIYQQSLGIDNLDNREQVETDDPRLNLTSGVANHIYDFSRQTGAKAVISPMESDFYLPVWQVSTDYVLVIISLCSNLITSLFPASFLDVPRHKEVNGESEPRE